MARALSPTQRGLLAEVIETGTLYVRRYSPPGRTVAALSKRGLVRCEEHDYSQLSMDGWVATDAGRELAGGASPEGADT